LLILDSETGEEIKIIETTQKLQDLEVTLDGKDLIGPSHNSFLILDIPKLDVFFFTIPESIGYKYSSHSISLANNSFITKDMEDNIIRIWDISSILSNLGKDVNIIEQNFSKIFSIIEKGDYSKALELIDTLKANSNEFYTSKIDEKIQYYKVIIIRKVLLNYSTKYARIQVSDIIDKTGVKDENLIINIIKEMIKNEEIHAEFFPSSKSIVFNLQANINEIDKLMEVYKNWESDKVGKK